MRRRLLYIGSTLSIGKNWSKLGCNQWNSHMADLSGLIEGHKEKRRYARAAVDAPTWVRIPSQFASDHYSAEEALGIPSKLKDLSFSGAKVAGTLPVGRVGETIELVLPVTRGGYISVIGEIVRVDGNERETATAVHFSRISISDQEQLSEVMGILLSRQSATDTSTVKELALNR